MSGSMENIMMTFEAQSVEDALEILEDVLRAKRNEYHRLLKEAGDGNVYFFLDEVEEAERALEKLADLLGKVCLFVDYDYEAPVDADPDEEDG